MFYPHKVEIEKLDQAQAADWQPYSAAPVAARVVEQGDQGDNFRGYQVELPWSKSIAEMAGLQSLGYGFRLKWVDGAGLARDLEVESVTLPTERRHRTPAVLQCRALLNTSQT